MVKLALKDGDCIEFAKQKYDETLEFRQAEHIECVKWKDEKLTLGLQYKDSKLEQCEEWRTNTRQSCITWWIGVRWICVAYSYTVYGLWFALEWIKHIIAVWYVYEIFANGVAWNWIAASLKLVWYSIVTFISMVLIWIWKPLRPAHKG